MRNEEDWGVYDRRSKETIIKQSWELILNIESILVSVFETARKGF